MGANVDIAIAFVILILGISVTLQILMDTIKDMLNLRWSTYRAVLETLFSEYSNQQQSGWQRFVKKYLYWPGNGPNIGSITTRLKSFATQLPKLVKTAQEVREELETIAKDLEEARDDKTKRAAALQAACEHLGHVGSGLQKAKQRLNRLNLASFLSTASPAAAGQEGGGMFASLRKNLAPVSALANTLDSREVFTKLEELIQSAQAAQAKVEDAAFDTFKQGLNAALEAARGFEQRVSDAQEAFVDRFDEVSGRLQNQFKVRMSKWTFRVGLVLCLALNADAMSMYESLQREPVLRQSVIAQSEALTKTLAVSPRAAEVQELSTRAAEFRTTLTGFATDATQATPQAVGDLRAQLEAFRARFDQVSDALTQDAGAAGVPLGGDDPKQLYSTMLTAVRQAQPDWNAVARGLQQAMGRLGANLFRLSSDRVTARVDTLMSSNLPLGWADGEFSSLFGGEQTGWPTIKKLLGVLLTAFLISFGAPFWDNVLKALLGIRGALRSGGSAPPAAVAAQAGTTQPGGEN